MSNILPTQFDGLFRDVQPSRAIAPRSITWHGENSARIPRSIPKRIWAFWNSEELPKLVRACIESWRKHNPDYQIAFITPRNISAFVSPIPDEFDSASPQRQSDWVRLAVLEQYGGFWLDATTLTFKPLDFVHRLHEQQETELVAYFNDGQTADAFYPIVENWFLAAPLGSSFVSAWKKEFEKSIYLGAERYIDSLKLEFNIDKLRQNLRSPTYFSMHIAAQVLLRRPNSFSLSLLLAESDAFKIAKDLSWKFDVITDFVCVKPEPPPTCNIFKMIGKVWKPIHEEVENGRYTTDSIVGRLLDSAIWEQTHSPEAIGFQRTEI